MSLLTTKTETNAVTQLIVPNLATTTGVLVVMVAIGRPNAPSVTFTYNHPAVTTWTRPPNGRANATSIRNPDWSLAAEVVYGTCSTGSGNLSVTFSASAWRSIIAIWLEQAAPNEAVNASAATNQNHLGNLVLPFTAQGKRLSLSFFDGEPSPIRGDFATITQLPTEQYRVGAAGEEGTTWTPSGRYAFTGVAVGAVIPATAPGTTDSLPLLALLGGL